MICPLRLWARMDWFASVSADDGSNKKDGWEFTHPSRRTTTYVGEGDESAAFLSLGERLVLKSRLRFDQVMAYRPSLRFVFQAVYLSQPPFSFLSSSYNKPMRFTLKSPCNIEIDCSVELFSCNPKSNLSMDGIQRQQPGKIPDSRKLCHQSLRPFEDRSIMVKRQGKQFLQFVSQILPCQFFIQAKFALPGIQLPIHRHRRQNALLKMTRLMHEQGHGSRIFKRGLHRVVEFVQIKGPCPRPKRPHTSPRPLQPHPDLFLPHKAHRLRSLFGRSCNLLKIFFQPFGLVHAHFNAESMTPRRNSTSGPMPVSGRFTSSISATSFCPPL